MLHHRPVYADVCTVVRLPWTTFDVARELHAFNREFAEQDKICVINQLEIK